MKGIEENTLQDLDCNPLKDSKTGKNLLGKLFLESRELYFKEFKIQLTYRLVNLFLDTLHTRLLRIYIYIYIYKDKES